MKVEEKYDLSTHEAIPAKTKGILNEYLLSLKLSNRAEATITSYSWVLGKFLSQCQVPLEKLSSDDVRQWLKEHSVNKKPRTINLFISVLLSFFEFCLDEDYMEKMIIKKGWKLKIPQSLPKYLSKDEYAHVKRVAEALPVRDRALILFLFSTGCRVSQVANLNRQDIDLKKQTAVVRGKRKEIRYIHFTKECALVLDTYLQTRLDDQEVLFLNKFGGRLTTNGIYRITRNLGEKAGLNQYLHPQMFRHTFATQMLSKGANLEFIAYELGLNNLNTIYNYARISPEDWIMGLFNYNEE